MNTKQREQIAAHGRQLLAIFPNARIKDPIELCRALRRIERKAHNAALRMCNDAHYSEAQREKDDQAIEEALHGLLGVYEAPVMVNKDPRGYALKIHDSWMKRHPGALWTDWGGYGILAPEIQ